MNLACNLQLGHLEAYKLTEIFKVMLQGTISNDDF